MSLTQSRLEQLHDDRYRRVGLRPPVRRPGLRRWLGEPGVVPGRWPLGLALAWLAVLAAAVALEPAPAEPAAPEPVWAAVLFLGLLAALGTAWSGLSSRRRLGLVASVVAAGLGLAASAACPVSAHHVDVGAWWYLQMGGFTALVGAGLAGLRAARA